MDVVSISADMIPHDKWLDILDVAGYDYVDVCKWLKENYQARDIGVVGRPFSKIEFPREKYAEFCLRWM
jgi:hypothetical protein